jgi:hypothetical protein
MDTRSAERSDASLKGTASPLCLESAKRYELAHDF